MEPLRFTAVCRLNEVEAPYDGGRLVLRGDDAQVKSAGFIQAELILNAHTDDAMRPFPSTRAGMEQRRFRITVEEITE